MAWTTPRTWVTGEVLTSSLMNTHVRDNLSFLHAEELAYQAFTSPVTVSATTEGAATTIVTAQAVTGTGSQKMRVEFSCAYITMGASATLVLVLYDSTSQGLLVAMSAAAANYNGGVIACELTPSAASHTYSIRGYRATADCVVGAGLGGVGAYLPGAIRVVAVNA